MHGLYYRATHTGEREMCKEYEIDRAVNGQHGGSSCPLGEHTYTSPSSHILCSCRILEASYHMLVYNHHALLRVVRANRSTIMHELARGRIDHTRSFLARAFCHNGSNNPPPPPGAGPCRASGDRTCRVRPQCNAHASPSDTSSIGGLVDDSCTGAAPYDTIPLCMEIDAWPCGV
jgi:hypothetical protein